MDPARQLVRELVGLRRTNASLAVDVRHGDGDPTTTFFLREGELVSVHATRPTFPLGRTLVRQRLLTREQCVEVLQRLVDARNAGDEPRFGEIVVGLGYASVEDVMRALVEQVRGPAVRLFLRALNHAEPLTWTTRELDAARDMSRETPLDIETIFLDAVRRSDPSKRVELVGAAAQSLALATDWDIAEIEARFDLGTDEAQFVREALAGDRVVAELCAKERSGVDATALVGALLATGAAASRPPAAARGFPPPGRRLRRQPPRWARIDLTAAKVIAGKAVMARGAPESPSGAPFGRMVRGERAFEQGRELFRKGDVKRALSLFEAALGVVVSSNDECDLLVRWCRLWVRQEGLSNEASTELEARARAVLADDPELAFAHFVLGEALHAQGKMDDARKHLMQSIRLERELLEGVRDRRLANMRVAGARRISDSELRVSEAEAGQAPVFPKSNPALFVGLPTTRAHVPEPPTPPQPIGPQATYEMPLASTVPAEPQSQGGARPIAFVVGALGIIVLGAILGVVAASWDFGPSTPKASTASTASTASAARPTAGAPSAGMPAASTPVTGASVARPLPLDAGAAGADASAPARASETASDAGAPGSATGRVKLPRRAIGHRVFVDGRVAATDAEELVLPCGRHDLRIGSRGATRSIDVPCGAELDLRAETNW